MMHKLTKAVKAARGRLKNAFQSPLIRYKVLKVTPFVEAIPSEIPQIEKYPSTNFLELTNA